LTASKPERPEERFRNRLARPPGHHEVQITIAKAAAYDALVEAGRSNALRGVSSRVVACGPTRLPAPPPCFPSPPAHPELVDFRSRAARPMATTPSPAPANAAHGIRFAVGNFERSPAYYVLPLVQ